MIDNSDNDINDELENVSEEENLSDDSVSDDPAHSEENLQNKIDEHWEKILRLQAEIENIRKRNVKDIESAAKASIERVFQEIIPNE